MSLEVSLSTSSANLTGEIVQNSKSFLPSEKYQAFSKPSPMSRKMSHLCLIVKRAGVADHRDH